MEHMEPMDDREIQEKVESLAGKGTKVVDCEKSTSFESKEILLVNGYPVPLIGDEGAQIKRALLEGQIPSGDLLNQILIRAGILKTPVELETELNVKSTTKTTELLTLRDKDGVLLDERVKEVEEDNEFSTKSTERWKKHHSRHAEELKRLGRRVEELKVEPQQSSSSPSSSPSDAPPPESSPFVREGRSAWNELEEEEEEEIKNGYYEKREQQPGYSPSTAQQSHHQSSHHHHHHIINGKDQDHKRLISDETGIERTKERILLGSGKTSAATLSVPQIQLQPHHQTVEPLRSSFSMLNSHQHHHVPLVSTQPPLPENNVVHSDRLHSKSHFHYGHNNLQSSKTTTDSLSQNNMENHPCSSSVPLRFPPLSSSPLECCATGALPVRFTYETFV